MKKLSVTVSGRFAVNKSHKNQCGTKGQQVFDYEATITGYSCDIDEDTGFLLDNAWILKYFESGKLAVGSCETMALRACNELVAIMNNEEIYPARVYVKIKPNSFAFLECEWTPSINSMKRISFSDRLTFGQYHGKTTREVYYEDRDYYNWLVLNAEKLGLISTELIGDLQPA